MIASMKPFLDVLINKKPRTPAPVWLMRQAGRYLPEYRELRSDRGSFLNLVYSPEDAMEVTLQPIRRYQMDGAILFSDILIVPHALGANLDFKKGEGPVLSPIRTKSDFEKLTREHEGKYYEKIYETCRLIRKGLEAERFDETTLIGFAGAPWTVACYMIQGHGKTTFPEAQKMLKENEHLFDEIISFITDSTITYLSGQIEAGAEAIQIFESWASLLEGNDFEEVSLKPVQKIMNALKTEYPHIPVLFFPKTENETHLSQAGQLKGLDGLSLSYEVPLSFLEKLPATLVTQGNLDPEILLAGGDVLKKAVQEIVDATRNRPHIFNLGHGVIKETPPEHVTQLLKILRENRF